MELLAQIRAIADATAAQAKAQPAEASEATNEFLEVPHQPTDTLAPLPKPIYNPPKAAGIAIAAASGAFFKLYDDFIDLSFLPESHILIEFFKVGITVFTTLMLSLDVYTTFFFLFLSVLELAAKSADTPYWRAGILIPLILFFLHMPHFVTPSLGFVIVFVILTLGTLFIVYVEKQTFPEETSSNKIINRILLFIANSFVIYNIDKYANMPYAPIICSWVNGYVAIYIITHAYDLYRRWKSGANKDE